MIDSSKLTGLAGAHVVGTDGDKIGRIVDVYESTDSDSGGTFVTVATGLFGTGASFLPLDAAELRGDDVVVPYTKDFVKHAPRVDNDEELSADEEDKLFTYYDQQGVTPVVGAAATGAVDEQGTVGHDTSGPTTDDAMTRSEERLHVGTEQREAGRARLRKYIVSETQTRTVPVSHDEVRLQREPITDANRPDALSGPTLSEEEHEVVLTAEQPVVAKETVPVERVRLGVNTVQEQETVTEQVRKEQIELDEDTTTVSDDRLR